MTWFIVDTTYTADRAALLAARPAHRDFLVGLVDTGTVAAGGPWADDLGGMFIASVADRAELDALLAIDPYTTGGVIASQRVREWKPVLGDLARPAQQPQARPRRSMSATAAPPGTTPITTLVERDSQDSV